MNNKGQVALVGLMIGLIIFLLGISLINPIKSVIEPVRGSTQLDCANSSISDGQKLTCLATDLLLPYFIVVVIALAIGYMTIKSLS